VGVGVEGRRLAGLDVLVGVGLVAGVDVAVGFGDGVGLVRAGVAVVVQPPATANAATAPARTNAGGFTKPL
jgi:hypothetical protein